MNAKLRLILKATLCLLPILLVISLAACMGGECSHTWGEWEVTVAPTCNAAGTQTRTCTQCAEKQEESVAKLTHEFASYTSNNDATCTKNATETATCPNCNQTDTREIANSKNPTVHSSTDTRYQENTQNAQKHDKVYVCCNAIIESIDHTWNDGEAHPTEQGVTVYTCVDCGKEKREAGAAHTHSATRIEASEAGCSEYGNIEYWYCAGCDTCFADEALTTEIEEDDTLVSPSHVGGTATCKNPAICTRCNDPYGSANPENHENNEYIFAVNAADETKHDKKYACCGAVIETSAHRNDAGSVDGTVTVYVCLDCDYETRVPLAEHVHSATNVPAKAASCTESGNIEYWFCEGCQKYFADEELTQEVTAQSVTLAPEHTSTEYTYAVNSSDPSKHDVKYKCCGTIAHTLDHEYELEFSYAATCTENGRNVYSCICEETKTEYTSPASGHSVEEWELASESKKENEQCVYLQNWEGICFVCRTAVTKQSEAVRHSYKSTITLSPTCVTPGEKVYACECGDAPDPETEEIAIDPDAHDWDNGTTEAGITTYTCLAVGCGAHKSAIVSQSSTETLDASKLESNELILGDVSLKLDSSLLGNLNSDAEVTLTAAPIVGDELEALIAALPESLRNQIENGNPVFDFALTQNGSDVDFNGGSIVITMKYDLPVDVDADCITVWYLDKNGDLSFYNASYYEVGEGGEKQGYIRFNAEHFSAYAPGIAPSDEACSVYEHLWETTVTAPTCTERGFTEYHCQRCGESKIDDILYALGHSYEITDMTPSTCQTTGSRTQVCTRKDCEYETTVVLSLAAHNFAYDADKTVEVTCTQDGVVIHSCTTPGCDETKEYDRYEAWGHSDYRAVSARLVGDKCTDGVIITYQCSNPNYVTNERCTHTIEKTVYTHTNEYSFEDNKDNFDTREPEKIMLGSYLAAAGISYMEEPYIEIKAGCLCGEQGSEIAIYDGTNQNGEQLFWCNGEILFRSTEAPYPTNQLWDRIFTATSFTYDPSSGPMEKSWTIRFSQELIKDECTYTYSVKVEFGYNSQTETAESSTSIELCTYDVHVNTTRTATLDDPNKSCYYNCSVDGDFVYGIHVKDTCDDCGSVTNEFDTSVSTSSSHYYTNIEVYEGPNGFKVYIRTCPCGATRCDNGSYNDYNNNYAGVSSVNRGDYSFTSTTENINGKSVTIYTGTYNSETFIYVVESIAYYDKENCVDDSYVVLYLDCDADNYKICDKVVECKLGATPLHKYETSTQDLPIDGNPCYQKSVTTSSCIGNCGRTNVSESIVAIHNPTETTKTDAKGNETYTAYCEICGYNEIIAKNANGDILRSYVETPVVVEGKLLYSITIELYTEFMGEIVPVLARCEVYEDRSKEVCVSWNETSYQYNFTSEPEKACIKTVTTTVSNSNGYMGVYTDQRICCEFGEVESKIPTCKEEGYERVVCKNCGYIEYYYGPQFGEHEIWSGEVECQERTCLQDGYERRYCANCDYFEETYYESSYGHEWMYSGDVMTTAGNSIQYSMCYRCGAYTGANYMPVSSADVMYKYNDGGNTVTIAYVNRYNPDATAIDATYQIVLFLKDYDEWGGEVLKVDDEGTPVVVTLEIDITDDGDGTLSFLHSDVTDAIGERDDVMVACLAVKSADGAVTYIVFGM